MSERVRVSKTWRQLEVLANEQDLHLFRTFGCVTVETMNRVPYVTITTDQLDDAHADRVVRAALGSALEALRTCE